MNKLLPGLIVMLLAASCSGGGGSDGNTPLPVTDPIVAGPSAAEQLMTDLEGLALSEFYNTSYKALISRTPETIVWQALTDTFPLDDVGLDDLSDAYQRDTFAMYQVVLDRLQTFDRTELDADEQLTYDVYQWHLQDKVDQLEFIYHDFAATYLSFSVQRDTQRFFTDIHPLATKQDAEDYVTRLNAVERKFSQLADHLNLQRNAGVVEPALTLDIAIADVANLAEDSADTHPYFTSFRNSRVTSSRLNFIPIYVGRHGHRPTPQSAGPTHSVAPENSFPGRIPLQSMR